MHRRVSGECSLIFTVVSSTDEFRFLYFHVLLGEFDEIFNSPNPMCFTGNKLECAL